MGISRRIIRKLGFKAECQGLIDRYIQVEGAWEEHLANTRNFIVQAVSGRKFNDLAVLGSGWLLDLPLEQLSRVSARVWLYDAVHPAQVIHKTRKFLNVSLLQEDITGGVLGNALEAVKLYKKNGQKPLPAVICHAGFKSGIEHDFVVSLNILSQIGELVTNYLAHHIPYSEEELTCFHSLLQAAHLQLLLPGKACLISDMEEQCFDREGGDTETRKLLHCRLPQARRMAGWEWEFDPLGVYRPGKRTVLQVSALEL